jgi:hypothetical protein
MDNRFGIVVGRTGCGKSCLVKNLVLQVPRVLVIDTVGEYGSCLSVSPDRLPSYVKRSQWRLRVVPENIEDVVATCEIARAVGHHLLVIEELAVWTTASSCPDEVANVFRLGRHSELDVLVVTQRPVGIPKLSKSLYHDFVAFQTVDPDDLDVVAEFTSPEAMSSVPKLRRFQYVHYWTDGGGGYETAKTLTPQTTQVAACSGVSDRLLRTFGGR